MTELEKLMAEQARLEGVKKEADVGLKDIKKKITAETKAEAERREKLIGKLAREAGIADWDDAKLMEAFRHLADPSQAGEEVTADAAEEVAAD